MITILYSIITSWFKIKNHNHRKKCECARYIVELIIAIGLGIGYAVWIVISIVSEKLFSPDSVVSFLVAQEAAVSGSLACLKAAVNSIACKSKPSEEIETSSVEEIDDE